MNLSELEQLLDNIQEILNFIEISQYQKRRNRIYLGNGDKLNFSVPNDTIAHLLGVNTNYLSSTGLLKNTYSFELVKEMCENPYRLYRANKDGIINFNLLFSPFILNKIEGFKENIKINTDDTMLVCKYDSTKTFITDIKSEKYDYIIVKKYNNGKIGILGLVNKENYYVPMSNQLFNNFNDAKETLNNYLKNQEITIMTGVNYFNTETDYDKTFYLNLNYKLVKIKELREYRNEFKCSLDLSGDYEYSIGRLRENRTNHFEDNDLIDIIVDSIKESKLIDTMIFRDTNLSKIIETFNDYLCTTQISQNSSIEETYTKIKTDLEHFKTELLNANKTIDNLTESNNKLKETINNLNEENNSNKETLDKVFEIVKKSRKNNS